MTSTQETPVSVFFGGDDPFTVYDATIHITDRIIGGIPRDPKLVEAWIRLKAGVTSEEEIQHRLKTYIGGLEHPPSFDSALIDMSNETAAETKTQGFHRNEYGQVVIEGRQLKSMLKESANICWPSGTTKFGQYQSKTQKSAGKLVGGKSAKGFFAERVFVSPDRIVIADDITDVMVSVGHIKDWKEQTRSTLGKYEYVEGCSFSFQVNVLDDCVSWAEWERLWRHAEQNGVGTMRSQGHGRFTLTEFASRSLPLRSGPLS